jgi:hypothetical protein
VKINISITKQTSKACSDFSRFRLTSRFLVSNCRAFRKHDLQFSIDFFHDLFGKNASIIVGEKSEKSVLCVRRQFKLAKLH